MTTKKELYETLAAYNIVHILLSVSALLFSWETIGYVIIAGFNLLMLFLNLRAVKNHSEKESHEKKSRD